MLGPTGKRQRIQHATSKALLSLTAKTGLPSLGRLIASSSAATGLVAFLRGPERTIEPDLLRVSGLPLAGRKVPAVMARSNFNIRIGIRKPSPIRSSGNTKEKQRQEQPVVRRRKTADVAVETDPNCDFSFSDDDMDWDNSTKDENNTQGTKLLGADESQIVRANLCA